jgi:hypothetical protein
MKHAVVEAWDAIMDNRRNPLRHLDLASQHYLMQVLGWMWSMVFSLAFLSIFQFGYVWLAHLLVIAGIITTVSVFREAERSRATVRAASRPLSAASRCVWQMDTEA